jgi:hypothetical protein
MQQSHGNLVVTELWIQKKVLIFTTEENKDYSKEKIIFVSKP